MPLFAFSETETDGVYAESYSAVMSTTEMCLCFLVLVLVLVQDRRSRLFRLLACLLLCLLVSLTMPAAIGAMSMCRLAAGSAAAPSLPRRGRMVSSAPRRVAARAASEGKQEVIKPLNGDPFIGMLETPVTSAPIVAG